MTLINLIRQRIESDGPMPFDAYMETCLYDELGFFGGKTVRSVKGGDFLTSPEVSPLFGQTISRYVAAERERIGDPFGIVEVGAGSGSLLSALLEEIEVEAWAVERSPAARATLSSMLGPERVVSSLAELAMPVRGVILANELLDNLPMAIAQKSDDGWRERWVGLDGERLVWVDAAPRSEVVAWLEAFSGPVADGGWVEVQLEAQRWLRSALECLTAGSLLVLDYGDTSDGLESRRGEGTLRTYRAHHLGPHPLDEPGETDITADVNFSALVATAAELGIAEVDLTRQEDFLSALGLRELWSELAASERDLASHPDPMERMRVRSLKTEAETLLHPRGLGDFRVLRIAR